MGKTGLAAGSKDVVHKGYEAMSFSRMMMGQVLPNSGALMRKMVRKSSNYGKVVDSGWKLMKDDDGKIPHWRC
jgi:hypothetical protein